MAKKRSWFNLIKRIFISDTKSKPEKKEKRRRWVFGRLKLKPLPTLEAPLPVKERSLNEAGEEQRRHALTVAIATAAAANVAVAASQAAVEVVRLTGTPQSDHQWEVGDKDFAAVKIQTAFRGYLARKALLALKGLVRLQAVIRGRAVRRQTVATLKCLQSIVNIQSQVCEKKLRMVEHKELKIEQKLMSNRPLVVCDMELESDSLQRWDDSVVSKEARNSMSLSKREAVVKRERIKEYSYSHREKRIVQRPSELEQSKVNERWSYWLEQWVDAHTCKKERTQFRLRSFQKQDQLDGTNSPNLLPRRSFHHSKQSSIGEDKLFSSSPVVVPTYMAATESAKAKTRSISTPKQRQGALDAYSDHNSPSKNRIYLLSSIDSEGTSTSSKIGKPLAFQQRSPSLKGIPGPIKSHRISKDLSLDSECSLLNWDRHCALR